MPPPDPAPASSRIVFAQSVMARLDALIPVPTASLSPEERRRLRTVYMAWASQVTVTLVTAVVGFAQHDRILPWIVSGCAILLMVSPLLHRRSRHWQGVAWILIGTGCTLIVSASLLTGAFASHIRVWLFAMLIVAMTTLGPAAAYGVAAVAILEIAVSAALHAMNISLPDLEAPEAKWTTFITAWPMAIAASVAFLHGYKLAHRRAVGELQTMHQRVQALIDAVPDAILRTDDRGTITFYRGPNREHATLEPANTLESPGDLAELNRADGLLPRAPERWPPSLQESVQQTVALALASQHQVSREACIEHQGSQTHVEIRAIVQADGETLSLLRDITGRKQSEAQRARYLAELERSRERLAAQAYALQRHHADLERAKDAAEAATAAKGEFLATMSHEIRTPMNGVMGMVQLLEYTNLDATQQDLLSTLRVSAEGLLTLLNDILDLSKIEAGQMAIHSQPMEPAALVQEVTALFQGTTIERGLQTTVTVDVDVPAACIGDPLRVRQILLNLVGNAFKFTAAGSVNVGLCARPATVGAAPGVMRFGGHDSPPDEARDMLVFSVSDTGIGIEQDALVRLFRPFVQANSSTTRRFGGTGLGLAICLRLAELMQGYFEVKSTVGIGSTFALCMPLRRTSLSAQARPHFVQSQKPWNGRVPRILLVEDNPVNRKVAEQVIARLGCSVQSLDNGVAACEAITQESFDVVLMDCQMPGLDGFQTTARIRAWEADTQRKPVPIVALTANALPEDRLQCLAQGMDDYLAKPFRVEDLREVIERLTRR